MGEPRSGFCRGRAALLITSCRRVRHKEIYARFFVSSPAAVNNSLPARTL
uniref:Uncharacterized protein n=1 Tax=Hyaloperonospora arabidopsidis (strain Emoy2) TaxID=559515 RepID=M4BTC6_HYAAE